MKQSKRNLAKALGVAGAGVAVWTKPVVDAVSLPAHAQTTSCSSVCWEVTWSFTGDFEGGGGYALHDSTCTLLDDNGDGVSGTGNASDCLDDLLPGTYYLFVTVYGEGSSGTVTVQSEVSCCNSEEVISNSYTSTVSGDADIFVEITIGEDATCSLEELTDGGFPCEL